MPVAYPINSISGSSSSHTYTVKKFRPLPQSGIQNFGQWVTTIDWQFLRENDDPNVQVEHFQKLLLDELDIFFPEKEVKISNGDLPFMTMELKLLDRQKKREYRKHKKSEKYLTLQSKYQVLFNNTSRSYFNNVIDNLMTRKCI